ncbi:MAG: prenyltransferase/squalene oxidase repeat-containing protein [Verrucomicrobiota bacterium]
MNQDGALPAQLEGVYLKGLGYLVKTQDKDGGWADSGMGGSGKQPAIAGLAILALLAHGDDPNSGPYAPAIKRGLNFLLKIQDSRTGYIGSSMYNHGFATLALAEAYGAVQDDRLGPALEKAVALSLSSQSRNPEGAWRYAPESRDADTTASGAIFVSLIAARNAGLAVPEDAIKKALVFYKKCALPGGGFGYTGQDGPSGPRNAIGLLAFALARQKDNAAFKDGLRAVARVDGNEMRSGGGYPFYYEYYAAQALFQSDSKAWNEWNQANLKRLAATQTAEGSWESQNGPVFSTAAGLLSLALNYRFLPIYER